MQLPAPPTNDQGLWAASFDEQGSIVWQSRVGTASSFSVLDVARDSTGAAIAVGSFYGTFELGSTQLTAPGTSSEDFLVELAPSGTLADALEPAIAARSVTVGAGDAVLLAGRRNDEAAVVALSSALEDLWMTSIDEGERDGWNSVAVSASRVAVVGTSHYAFHYYDDVFVAQLAW